MGRRERERYLKQQRARRQRQKPPRGDDADMRFRCYTCGAEFVHEGSMVIGDVFVTDLETGESQIAPLGPWEATCPVCGQSASAINEYVVSGGGRSVRGFADTPEQMAWLYESFEQLRKLPATADFDDIVATLEEQGPRAEAVVEYLTRHRESLTDFVKAHGSRSFNLVMLILTVLAWRFPVNAEQPLPPAPPGISYEQLERLLEEDVRPPDGKSETDDGAGKGDAGYDDGATSGEHQSD